MAKYTVTASSLNIRKGPSVSYAKVGGLTRGAVVEVTAVTGDWGQIGAGKYVSMTYLTPVSDSNTTGSKVAPSYYPTADMENRPIYFLQTDSRWKNKMYSAIQSSAQTIGKSGCGPTAGSMIVNAWSDPAYSPVECCNWAAKAGYRSANSGTYWSIFKALAVKYGYEFAQTASYNEAKNFMKNNPGALVACIMGKGNWTSGGHFILMYNCNDSVVYINDPNSIVSTRQKNTAKLLSSQCRQYFCFKKPAKITGSTGWAPKDKIIDITVNAYVVAASALLVRTDPTTSNGDNGVGTLAEGALVRATKKCGDWFYISGKTDKGKKVEGWVPATYLSDANINNVESDMATLAAEAIDYLVKRGFLNTPDYWRDHIFDIDYLTNLIMAIANGLADYYPEGSTPEDKTYTVDTALAALVDKGIINSPDYWRSNYTKVPNIDALITKAATWIC